VTARLRMGACLSLSGRFARFGRQAAFGLETWRSMTGGVDLFIDDDRSDPGALTAALPGVAARCDLLLGPYSTALTRAAAAVAAEISGLVWNHGGAGDDVQAGHSGHVVSVLTPASQYAAPFVRHLAGELEAAPLCIVTGRGSFGHQVAAGAAAAAHALGIEIFCLAPGHELPADRTSAWDLLSAGVFEDDVATIRNALQLPKPPRAMCSVAAGVMDFSGAVPDPAGIFGVGQWAPRMGIGAQIGPAETEFLTTYAARTGTRPDYPAVQAAAAAVLAAHCAQLAGGTTTENLWAAATSLDTTTLFGRFRIDGDGTQRGHEAVLVRWQQRRLVTHSS
jgi:Periplasmic binding protein